MFGPITHIINCSRPIDVKITYPERKKSWKFGASLRGTTQYWSHRGKELGALIQYQINANKVYLLFSPLCRIPFQTS
jgi:hypothetical protein